MLILDVGGIFSGRCAREGDNGGGGVEIANAIQVMRRFHHAVRPKVHATKVQPLLAVKPETAAYDADSDGGASESVLLPPTFPLSCRRQN